MAAIVRREMTVHKLNFILYGKLNFFSLLSSRHMAKPEYLLIFFRVWEIFIFIFWFSFHLIEKFIICNLCAYIYLI